MSITVTQALASIPAGLRDPLIAEYRTIANNFLEHRWLPAELGGGRFSEIVYTILAGFAVGTYAAAPEKPSNFVDACRRLESHSHVPRSFQILIPRFLPGLYEIRNNRGVGHVGGDVDPNFMDSTAVLAVVSWIMAELIRVFHSLTPQDAQTLVDALVERRSTLIWEVDGARRVLDPNLSAREQTLLLLFTQPTPLTSRTLITWIEYSNPSMYRRKVLQPMHEERLIEYNSTSDYVTLSPRGSQQAAVILTRYHA